MEAPRPLAVVQKDPIENRKLQKTPRDDAEIGEGEADAQGKGEEEQTDTTWYRKGTGPPVEAGRGWERA